MDVSNILIPLWLVSVPITFIILCIRYITGKSDDKHGVVIIPVSILLFPFGILILSMYATEKTSRWLDKQREKNLAKKRTKENIIANPDINAALAEIDEYLEKGIS